MTTEEFFDLGKKHLDRMGYASSEAKQLEPFRVFSVFRKSEPENEGKVWFDNVGLDKLSDDNARWKAESQAKNCVKCYEENLGASA